MRERDALLCDRLSRRLPIAVSIGIEGSIAFHNKLENAAQARMKKPRPTNDRGSACQTIWCRYASGIAGSMAPFSAKRKGRQSFAPRFVYPSKVQIKQMRGKLLPTSRVSCHRLRSVGKCSSAAQERAYSKTGPPFSTGCFILSQQDDGLLGAIPGGRFQPAEYRQTEGSRCVRKHKTQAVKDPAGDLARDLANLITRGIKRQNKLSNAERPALLARTK